jgi:hypothetical protein
MSYGTGAIAIMSSNLYYYGGEQSSQAYRMAFACDPENVLSFVVH